MKKVFKLSSKFLVMTLLVLSTMVGCSTNNDQEITETVSTTGFGGDVSVTVVVKGDEIIKCTAEGLNETEGVGSKAIEQLPNKIVEANSTDVDIISGATITSEAVKKAALEAINKAKSSNSSENTGDKVMKPGTYTATNRGYKSDVVVELVVDETTIISCNVIAQEETAGIGSVAAGQIPQDVVKYQSAMVDTVSGATATSGAVVRGVMQALEEAGADMDKFKVAPPQPTATDVELETDVVIVGAGGAGLTAGVEAALNGASVIVVEKMDIPGGNTIRSTGAWNVAGHPEQVAAEKGYTVDEFVQKTIAGGHNLNDESLVKYMAENSAEVTDWMREIGLDAQFLETYTSAVVSEANSTDVDTISGATNKSDYASGLVRGLVENLEKNNGELMLSTEVTEVIVDDNGAAVGIKAIGADGGNVTINSKAVIMATGGFGYNTEMCYELKPEVDGFITNNNVGATGDGLAMAEKIGANLIDLEQIQTHPTVHQATGTTISEGCRTLGAILINSSGKRFTDECNFRDKVSEAILQQDQGLAYILMNEDIVKSNPTIAGYVKSGVLTKYETISDLAKAVGVEEVVIDETLKTWNSYVAQKNDPEFNSQFKWDRDLSVGPWYMAPIAPGIHHTMGGIKINTASEVLTKDGTAIPGFFACGEVTGGVHGGNRVGGNAILDCLVFGKTAGNSAIKYINEK